MRRVVVCAVLLTVAGCAPKQVSRPDVKALPEAETAWQEPALYIAPPPPPARPVAKNEVRYPWEEGKADIVKVGLRYPTVVKFEPNEHITSMMDGDRETVTAQEADTMGARAQATENPHCYRGVRWQWCKGVSASQYTPVEHLVFTTTHPGHKQGVVVFTDRRSYYLELQSVAQTTTRLVSWSYPPPPAPPTPTPPGLFPDLAARRQFHVGYVFTLPDPAPPWTPVKVWSDVPTLERGAKVYIQFPPSIIHQRMPSVRGMNRRGEPYLVNARYAAHWVVIDHVPERLELRDGADTDAGVVVITRHVLRSITCPGDEGCPVWPF